MPSNTDLDFLTHPPDTVQVGIAFSILRAVANALAGAGFVWAAWDDNDLMMLATSIVVVGTIIWSVYQKLAQRLRNRRASIQSAVQSAEATMATGQPVAVIVTNPKD